MRHVVLPVLVFETLLFSMGGFRSFVRVPRRSKALLIEHLTRTIKAVSDFVPNDASYSSIIDYRVVAGEEHRIQHGGGEYYKNKTETRSSLDKFLVLLMRLVAWV